MTFISDSNKIAEELHKHRSANIGRPKKQLPRHLRKRSNMPPELEGVTLMSIDDVCEALRCSASWWLEQVREGAAPMPDVHLHRFTRWYVNTIREHLLSLSKLPKDTDALKAKAKKASEAARHKREAALADLRELAALDIAHTLDTPAGSDL